MKTQEIKPEARVRQPPSEEAVLYREFFGNGQNKYLIFPDYWPKKWGNPPLLGIVWADNEFLAERIAYDRGVLPTPNNCTFRPRFVVGTHNVPSTKH